MQCSEQRKGCRDIIFKFDEFTNLDYLRSLNVSRYAVLWLYGGAYVDDDSDIGVALDKVIVIVIVTMLIELVVK